MSSNKKFELTVLLATYNGSKYIRDQLISLSKQSQGNIQLCVSDDRSTDDTVNIIIDECRRHSHIELSVQFGPDKGFLQNFRSLILNVDPRSNYIAFSDQDDIWLEKKTKWSIDWLRQNEDVAALFCGRTQTMAADGRIVGETSFNFEKPPSFKNAVIQSIAGANTMTFNRQAFELMKDSMKLVSPVSHDWWAYQIVTGAGGKVYFSTNPLVCYRQHDANVVGANHTFLNRLVRGKKIVQGRFRNWNETNIKCLDQCKWLLNSEAEDTLRELKSVHNAPLTTRVSALARSGIYRQTRTEQFIMYAACAMKLL